MDEIWKEIKGYENLYRISNKGKVYSIRNKIIRKPNTDGSGYLKIELFKKGKSHTFKIHRLVCEAFNDNPNNLKEVNHIDGNILNNYSNNLEWCTSSYNSQHRIYVLNKNSLYPCKHVKCVELNKLFNSISNAARFVNKKQPTLSEVLNKDNRTCGGFHWITL